MSLRRIGTVCTLVSLLIIVSSVNAQGLSPAEAVVVDTRGFPEVTFRTETGFFVRLVKGTRLGVGDMQSKPAIRGRLSLCSPMGVRS